MVTYTEEEYTKIFHNPSWSKAETDYFWNLCQTYDLRFIVIQDRYDPSYPPRSVEDLKERFYSLSKEILLLRNQTTHPIISLPYNANYEKKRKALLEKYFLRTREQDEEEKALCEEARKLEIRIKKEEKEMKVFEKLMSNNSEEIEFSEWNQNKKELPKGPSLRSAQLFQPALPQRQQKKIESLLKDLLIPDRPMPTAEVIDLYTKLRKELFILLNLQKHVIKKENEKKNLEDRIREAKANQTKKSVSSSSNTVKSAQHAMAPAKVNTIKAPAALSNRQTIGPMNNLNSSYTTPRKSNQKGRGDGLEEADQVTPVKRLKKSQNP
jgi:DNA methyltransferase 1-associated protein 1